MVSAGKLIRCSTHCFTRLRIGRIGFHDQIVSLDGKCLRSRAADWCNLLYFNDFLLVGCLWFTRSESLLFRLWLKEVIGWWNGFAGICRQEAVVAFSSRAAVVLQDEGN